MIRGCDVCGRPYEAKRVSSRFCSGTCRKRNLRAPRPRLAETSPAAEDYALLAATRAELEAAGRLNSMLGQVALLLAERMCEFDTGSGTAALSKELRAVMAAAVQGAPAAADPVDELRGAQSLGSHFHRPGVYVQRGDIQPRHLVDRVLLGRVRCRPGVFSSCGR
jgi:hypothetical protein